jgi:hypothetical protein
LIPREAAIRHTRNSKAVAGLSETSQRYRKFAKMLDKMKKPAGESPAGFDD